MAAALRVHSSDSQVFFNGDRITGAQSSELNINKKKEDLLSLGEYTFTDKILRSNQTHEYQINVLAIESGFNLFETGNFLSIDEQEFVLKDPAGQMTLSGVYMTSCSLNVDLGEIPETSFSFEVNDVIFDTGTRLTPQLDQTNDTGVIYYRPQELTVSKTNFDEGVTTEDFCIQSVSLSVDIPRNAINKMGSYNTNIRYPQLPQNGTLSFDILKRDLVGIDLSTLVLDTGTMNIKLSNNGRSALYAIDNCAFIGASERLSLNLVCWPLSSAPLWKHYISRSAGCTSITILSSAEYPFGSCSGGC